MQWLRIISLRKQQESKDKFDDALKEMGSAKAVFEELRSTLKDIRTEVAKAEEERSKNSVPPAPTVIKTPFRPMGKIPTPRPGVYDLRRSQDDDGQNRDERRDSRAERGRVDPRVEPDDASERRDSRVDPPRGKAQGA